jgi:hypothetical protein
MSTLNSNDMEKKDGKSSSASSNYEHNSDIGGDEPWTPDYQNPNSTEDSNSKPDQENNDLDDRESHLYPDQNRDSDDDSNCNSDQGHNELDNNESHLYPDQNRNSLNSDSVPDPSNVKNGEDDKNDDFYKEDFEGETDFEEKDIDYREKKERDSF